VRTLRYGSPAFRRWLASLPRAATRRPAVERSVARILAAVRHEGDRALVRYTERFDGVALSPSRLRMGAAEVRRIAGRAEPELVAALRAMARRIAAYHRRQLRPGFVMRLPDGTRLEERVLPLDSVGLYVPGGAGAYPSSVLMNAIPAKVAGVPRIAVATPPAALADNPAVAAALVVVGLEDAVLRVGGAQAIAALAYGTRRVAAVSRIVGPGNAFVAAAKRQVRGTVEIDQEAGPSEVVILADGAAAPGAVAIDLLAQAELGGGDETVVLVTTSRGLAKKVAALVAEGVARVSNRAATRRALRRNAAVIEVASLAEGVAAVNALAPEHAEVITRGASRVARRIVAGSVFAGPRSPVAVGDYGVGPSHVLPTGGAARFSSPLSVLDFQRRQSSVEMSARGLARIGPGIATVARAEGFRAHAESVEQRLASPRRRRRPARRRR
jgi:histidinol dehydrogenase